MEYKCIKCGNDEFISQLNHYDIFTANGGKLEYIKTELTEEKIVLYCRNCSEPLQFFAGDLVT
jgi:predicted nucleic-acid-binding Zn-ribbon protein